MHRKQETKTRNENGLHLGSTNAERVCFGRIIFLLPMGDLNRRCHSRGDGDLMRDILYLFGAKGGAATDWFNRMTPAAAYQRRLLFLVEENTVQSTIDEHLGNESCRAPHPSVDMPKWCTATIDAASVC